METLGFNSQWRYCCDNSGHICFLVLLLQSSICFGTNLKVEFQPFQRECSRSGPGKNVRSKGQPASPSYPRKCLTKLFISNVHVCVLKVAKLKAGGMVTVYHRNNGRPALDQ